MRLLAPLLLALQCLLGCAAPSLEIDLKIPAHYRALVTSASLQVIVPPQGTPFTCEQIAFGEIGDSQILANTVEDTILEIGERVSLSAIPREASKILLATGYDASGQKVVEGCAEYTVVSAESRVDILGEVVTLASIPNFDPLRSESRATKVRITDVLGQSASGIEVHWTRTAAGTEPALDMALSDEGGSVSITIPPPPLPGPIAVEVRAKWARSDPPIVSGFQNPPTLFSHSLPTLRDEAARDPDEIYQVGRIGPSGELGLVVMGHPNADLQRRIHVAYYQTSSGTFQTVDSELLPPSAIAVALVFDGERDRIFTTSTTAVLEVDNNGSLTIKPLVGQIPIIRRFLNTGDCSDTGENGELLALGTDGSTRALRDGKVVSSMFSGNSAPGTPIASGCLSSGGSLHRAVVYTDAQDTTLLADIGGPRKTTLPIVSSGVTFSPKTDSDDALLIASTLSISGVQLSRYRVAPLDQDELSLELVASDATPTIAQSSAAGDFDRDGNTDIASVIVFGDSRGATKYRIFMAMGIESASGRVTGISAPNPGQRSRIFVRDFNSDGYDDLLIGSSEGYSIHPMGPL